MIPFMQTKLFDYHLAKEYIAQKPIFPRDRSRLMVLDRKNKTITHSHFYDLPQFLKPTDVLVFNQTKVIPARLLGSKENGAKLEVLLLHQVDNVTWEALTKPGLKENQQGFFDNHLTGMILKVLPTGNRLIKFNQKGKSFKETLNQIGLMPTPPYIKERLKNPAWYQTVYAKIEGSVAAPTAGFHFTKKLIEKLDKLSIQKEFITLHIGLDTFRPIRTDRLEDHAIHSEWGEVDKKTADKLNEYKKEGRRIIAVGTTVVRTLESATSVILRTRRIPASPAGGGGDVRIPLECAYSYGITRYSRGNKTIKPFSGNTRLFIYPPYKFQFVDGVITNFHLPKSTLLALVSAFAGRKFVLEVYEEAKRKGYRFFSFGDGMLIM